MFKSTEFRDTRTGEIVTQIPLSEIGFFEQIKPGEVVDNTPVDPTVKIRGLNDSLRRTFVGGKVLFTCGVDAMDDDPKAELLRLIRTFDDFSEENDPHGEHDFGAVDVEGTKYFWKIDYYDQDHQFLSDDPSDPKVTNRVLTIMEASEY